MQDLAGAVWDSCLLFKGYLWSEPSCPNTSFYAHGRKCRVKDVLASIIGVSIEPSRPIRDRQSLSILVLLRGTYCGWTNSYTISSQEDVSVSGWILLLLEVSVDPLLSVTPPIYVVGCSTNMTLNNGYANVTGDNCVMSQHQSSLFSLSVLYKQQVQPPTNHSIEEDFLNQWQN